MVGLLELNPLHALELLSASLPAMGDTGHAAAPGPASPLGAITPGGSMPSWVLAIPFLPLLGCVLAGLCAIYPSSRAIRCDPEVRTESLEGGGCSASPGGRGGVGIALLGGVVTALASWRRRRSASNS